MKTILIGLTLLASMSSFANIVNMEINSTQEALLAGQVVNVGCEVDENEAKSKKIFTNLVANGEPHYFDNAIYFCSTPEIDCTVRSINVSNEGLSEKSIELLSQRYVLTDEASPLELFVGGDCQKGECGLVVDILKESNGVRKTTGNSAYGEGSDDWFGSGKAEDHAIENAISKLKSCI